jgi:choline dehydrogenase-like flavoprotein
VLLNAENWEEGWFGDFVFDVCICGAGPAGITLARALAAKKWRVALLEAGGFDIDSTSQVLYAGSNVGLPYFPLETCRLRYFGGTSNHWEGYSRPLDAGDFEPLPYHLLNEWPIRNADLQPYASKAAEILDLPAGRTPYDVFGGKSGSLVPISYRKSPPTRFGSKYRNELVQSTNIAVIFNSNLVDIELASSFRHVSALVFRAYSREETFRVRGKYTVLCCGALENARILLNSNRQITIGIGNEHDLVGRFFAEHPHTPVGNAIMSYWPKSEWELYYVPTSSVMLKHECLAFQLEINPMPMRGNLKSALCSTSLAQRVSKILLGIEPMCFDVRLSVMIAQAVNWESRVTLSNEVDRMGMRRIVLDWQLSELDYHTIRCAALEIGRVLAETNVGRMKLLPWLRDVGEKPPSETIKGNFHHMCTTRMSQNPKHGVVDKNCCIHGFDNLFVGGSSVFASSGVSNPTYTIVQLALRLGDHLDFQLRLARHHP